MKNGMENKASDWPVTFSALEALTWIAFRRYLPGGLWTDLLETQPSRDWNVLPPAEWEAGTLATIWLVTAPALIAALEARARRSPGPSKPCPPVYRAWLYRAAARRLVRSTGLEAGVLANKLRQDLKAGVSAQEAIEKASISLQRALAEGSVKATGIITLDRTEVPNDRAAEEIPAIYFASSPKFIVDVDGFTDPENQDYEGPFWGCVEIWSAALIRAFPSCGLQRVDDGLADAGQTRSVSSTGPAKPSASKRRQSGGLDYGERDALLAKEALAMIEDGRARNINDAALILTERAAGRGSIDSRRKRLILAIQKAVGQSGQN
ncbi:hypothetical protein [Roseomonas sp. 18066]|uniref:hypothetical protein n=1 Tax=Roseomonas sp. 18066 TaxID=2681412 RepID=UPI00135AF7C4|nr:hypothetical protein [Roseomonas sp. 18066]